MIKKRKVGKATEYEETIRCACGHSVTLTTMGQKADRGTVAGFRKRPCVRCEISELVEGKKAE